MSNAQHKHHVSKGRMDRLSSHSTAQKTNSGIRTSGGPTSESTKTPTDATCGMRISVTTMALGPPEVLIPNRPCNPRKVTLTDAGDGGGGHFHNKKKDIIFNISYTILLILYIYIFSLFCISIYFVYLYFSMFIYFVYCSK